jgi:hypothetical protein
MSGDLGGAYQLVVEATSLQIHIHFHENFGNVFKSEIPGIVR